MKKNITSQRGFTLIELLVVIAIIGILSAVVLASLSTARSKGADAAVKSDLSTIRTEAELYYSDHNKYGTLLNNSCPTTAGTMFGDDAQIKNAIAQLNITGGGAARCYINSTGSDYAISVQLKSVTSPQQYWCIDSTGVAKAITSVLGTYKCP